MYKVNIRQVVKFLVFSFLIVSYVISAQSNEDSSRFLPNIIPPSPVSYELGQYGNMSVGMFTGSTNINIPIFSYKSSNLQMPISLFYNNNGIKVDNTSGLVGLGWGINMGGVINRVIRDKKDDTNLQFPNEKVLESGINPEKYEFYQKIGNPITDSEPDLFSFNFNGYSGQFIYDEEGNILMLKANNVKIEYLYIDLYFGFVATTPDGIKYYFFATETTLPTGGTGGGTGGGLNASVTSWLLTKIKHPKGDEIYLAYEDYDYQYIASKSQTLMVPLGITEAMCAQSPFNSLSISLHNIEDNYLEIFGKRLAQVSTNNAKNGILTFAYNQTDPDIVGLNKLSNVIVKNEEAKIIEQIDFNYEEISNKRTFLKEVVYLDPTKKYSFEYIDQLGFPERLSLGQDIWGYYNGKSNTSIVPKDIKGYGLENVDYNGADRSVITTNAQKGMLSKIIYPTKGYTKIDYESNDYYGQKITYPPITTVRASAILPGNEIGEKIILSLNNQRIKIKGRAFFNENCTPNMNTGHNEASFQVFEIESNKYIDLYQLTGDGKQSSIGTSLVLSNSNISYYFDAVAGKSYKGIVQLNAPCTRAYCDISYYATLPVTTMENIITGGIRVKNQDDYHYDNSIKNKRRYYYSDRIDDLQKSSGKIMRLKPFYGDIITTRAQCPGLPVGYIIYDEKREWFITSSSIISLFSNEEGQIISYPKVIESIGGDNFENGAVEHQYKINKNSAGNLLLGTDIQSTPSMNDGWDNGNELTTITYSKLNNSLIRVNEKIFHYKLDERISKSVTAFSCRKNFDLIQPGDAVYYCQADDIGKMYFDGYTCTTNHSHQLWIPSGKCIAIGSNNVKQYRNNSCFSSSVGTPVYYASNIENLSIKSYQIKSNWSYLENTTDIQYDLNGLNPVSITKNYSYNNSNHLQLSSLKNSTSITGQALETKYFYSLDNEMINEPFRNELIASNIIAIPLDTQTFKIDAQNNSVKLSEQKTVYEKWVTTNNLLLPKNMLMAKFPNATNGLENKITYNQYDDKGNVLQYTIEKGTPVTIIWGYNKTQPIAKIENAVYASITPSLITAAQTASDTGTETDLLTALTTLRSSLPNNVMVTTYTYIPLVGISTVTDPKGDKITYTYDSFGRLQFVKDKNGNILSENQYNYKQ